MIMFDEFFMFWTFVLSGVKESPSSSPQNKQEDAAGQNQTGVFKVTVPLRNQFVDLVSLDSHVTGALKASLVGLAPSVTAAQCSHCLQLIISHLSTLTPLTRLVQRRHVPQGFLLLPSPCVLGHGPWWTPHGPRPQPNGPGAVLGRRPVRLLRGSASSRDGVFLALRSPRREILPQLHGEKKLLKHLRSLIRTIEVFLQIKTG